MPWSCFRRWGCYRLALFALIGAAAASRYVDMPEDHVWKANPVARHLSCSVEVNVPAVCFLAAWEETGLGGVIETYVRTLPKVGLLLETSPAYRLNSSDIRTAPDPVTSIGAHLLPYKVTDVLNRVVYVPPLNDWGTQDFWSSFEYEVIWYPPRPAGLPPQMPDPEPIKSEIGLVVLANPKGSVAGSNFDGAESYAGWSLSGNLGSDSPHGGLRFQDAVLGGLSRYIYGVDEVMFMDFETGLDQTRWYFESSPNFYARELAAAYGGWIRFSIRSLYGNFTELNAPLDWISIECESCHSGSSLKIVRFIDESFSWEGSELKVEVPLTPMGKWKKDTQNSAAGYVYAGECEIAAVLNDVSRLAILGDFARGGEGVALDDVAIVALPDSEQPAHPVACQQGCTCRDNPKIARPKCC
eukprot:TRINITY_DN25944_c1_g1_i2.p1 TRINITY_DN25944_c1_g1~~TRINITY_DN25944_c1_g1_i2.p1  ORF type:complete len:413 (+),score=90.34 TRINITY_DN25944_c1_g1_i2:133-1371(+)